MLRKLTLLCVAVTLRTLRTRKCFAGSLPRIDEPVVEQILTPEQKAQQMLQNIEFITDRGNYEEYPYVWQLLM